MGWIDRAIVIVLATSTIFHLWQGGREAQRTGLVAPLVGNLIGTTLLLRACYVLWG